MACVTAILPLALKRIGLYLVRFPFVCVFFFHFIQSKRVICYWKFLIWKSTFFLFSTLRKNAALLFVEKITPKKFCSWIQTYNESSGFISNLVCLL